MMSKMKVSSSPGRPDRFPTPLMMRFLRSNVGSRSRGRGRSRSSPSMFIMRTKKNAAVISDANQPEPSSPKVTCIGQVRARRSAKKAQSKRRSTRNKPVSCCSSSCSSSCVWCSCSRSCSCSCPSCSCSFCCFFRLPKLRRPRLCFAGFFRRFGYCKKIDARDDSIVSITRQASSAIANGGEGAAHEYRVKEGLLESPGPPKNALLLTRCRSAPYRSSSLAGRFWGSDGAETEPETKPNTSTLREMQDDYREAMDGGASGKPNSPCSVNGEVEEEDGEESRKCCSSGEELELESCETDNVGVSKMAAAAGSLVLTRCKSEPARTGERLAPPEASFCQQRRSDTSQACLRKGTATAAAAHCD